MRLGIMWFGNWSSPTYLIYCRASKDLANQFAETMAQADVVVHREDLDDQALRRARPLYGGSKACYSPTFDKISMPLPADFHTKEGFAATLLHELAHWTGHPSRLNRDMKGQFGTSDYAYEELVAELASAQLCGRLGIDPQIENHASYIGSWLTKLKNDKTFFLKAAKDSQKVVDFLIND